MSAEHGERSTGDNLATIGSAKKSKDSVEPIDSTAKNSSSDSDGRSSSNSNRAKESPSMAEWEVIEDDTSIAKTASPEVSKKAPPAVREKPRKVVAASTESEEEAKKVPILPPTQSAALASILQKGVSKSPSNQVSSAMCVHVLHLLNIVE